jgi:transcriptional regulator with XRE-family HTH domain
MKSQFGERLRTLREKHNLYLRQVAPLLEMDTAQLSKIEKGLRQLKREQIVILADILNVEKDELLTLWVADQIIDVTSGEDVALKAMQVAEKEIINNRKKTSNSGNK